MNRTYNVTHGLVAYVLLFGFFLQGCGGQNQLVSQEKKQTKRILELSDNPLINTDKEIVISGGYLASFYEENGELKADLRADAIQPQPNYKGISVLVEEGANLANLIKLDLRIQQQHIELNRSNRGQLSHITICNGGLSGGMMEGDTNSSGEKKFSNNLNKGTVARLQARFLNSQIETTQTKITPRSTTSLSSRTFNNPRVDKAGIGEKKKEKEKEPITSFHASEITAYKRLNLNKILPAISKKDITYGRELGRGGFGVVYQGEYQEKTVAIKSLLRCSEQQIADFQKEAVIMANHRHPNIVAFLGYCPEENAFLMEYISGGSLSSLLKSSKDISWQERYQIALDIAEGMSYLHGLDIVHSDLKSDNILLDHNNRAKVTDFGISALKSENSTHGDRSGWSYRWIAPEIYHTEKNTKAGDVYSYGMVLWQLGARREPFSSLGNIFQLAKYISEGNQEIVSTDTPPGIRKVIEQCWLPEPPLRKDTDTQARPEMKQVRYLLEDGYHTFLSKERLEATNHEKESDKAASVEVVSTIKEYRKAADQGYAYAQCNLGMMYEDGRGVEKNDRKAVEWYQKAAEQEYAQAQCNLGMMYEDGRGVEKNDHKAVEWYQKAAEQEYAQAQYNLGIMYEDGRGVEKNDRKAVEWYQKAADQRLTNAQVRLGVLYEDGRGVVKDEKKAVEWYQKAADQENSNAQARLGWMYARGRGVEKDEEKAAEWYQKAAEQGYAYAQCNLGMMYENGRGVEKNDRKAVEWYQKAADQGYAQAQYNLGWAYGNGRGVAKDEKKAVEWYQKAADQGYAEAQFNLGLMYEDGRGVEKNDRKAVEWYQKAADQGCTVAKKRLDELNNSRCKVS